MKKIVYIPLVALVLWPLAAAAATEELSLQPPPVLITEIQIEGQSSKDEFVEIFNTGDQPINLAGWRLSRMTGSGNQLNLLTEFPEINLAGKQFLLIAHADYTGQAGLTFSTQQSIADNNTVTLYSDAGQTIVDQVGWGEAIVFQGQAAVSPEKGFSLQRKIADNLFISTNNNFNDFKAAAPTPGAFSSEGEATAQEGELGLEEEPTPDGETDSEFNQAEKESSDEINEPPDEIAEPLNAEEDSQEKQPSQANTKAPAGGTSSPAPQNDKPAKPKVVFSELFPNPIGPDHQEFVELKNEGNELVNLTFWKIKDNHSEFIFEPERSELLYLRPGGLLLLERKVTRLALNNGKDSLTLIDANNKTIDKIKFIEAEEGAAFIKDRHSGQWRWSGQPTPGQENVFVEPAYSPQADLQILGEKIAGRPITFDASDSFDRNGDPLKFQWEIRKDNLKIKKQDEIVGLILEEHGTYYVTLTITDPTGKSDQLDAKFTLKKNLRLEEMKKLEAAAVKEASKNGPAQNTSASDKAAENDLARPPVKILTSQLKNHHNQLVTLAGEVVEMKSGKIFLFDEAGEAEVNIKPFEKKLKSRGLTVGAKGEITGLAIVSKSKAILAPRSLEDFRFESPPPEQSADTKRNWFLPSVYGGLGAVLLGSWLVQKKLKHKA